MESRFLNTLPEAQLDHLIKHINSHKPFEELAEFAMLVTDYVRGFAPSLSKELLDLAAEVSAEERDAEFSNRAIPEVRERLTRVLQAYYASQSTT